MAKTKLLFLTAFLMSAAMLGCKSKTVVRKIPTEANKSIKSFNGVPYRLPRTVVSVTVPVKLTQTKPGPYVQFAPCFFPNDLGDLVTAKSREIEVQTPTFDSFGEPDPKENYMVSIKGGFFENKSLLMEFSPRGVLKKGEATSEDKSLEFTLKAIQTATAIGGSIIGTRDLKDPDNIIKNDQAKVCYEKILKYKNELEGEERSKTAARDNQAAQKVRKTIDAFNGLTGDTTKKIQSFEKTDDASLKIVQTSSDDFSKANAVFNKFTELLRRRDGMVSSPSDASADSFKLRLAETDKQIEAYRQLFLGIPTESLWNAVFQLRPNETEQQYSKPILAFIKEGFDEKNPNNNAGICAELGLVKENGVQPPKKFKVNNCSKPPGGKLEAVWIEFKKDSEDKTYLDKVKAVNQIYADKNKERGWYFRIAAKANLFARQGSATFEEIQKYDPKNKEDLSKEFVELARTDMAIGQMGVVASIPASGGGRSQQSALELNGITGELVNFKYASTSAMDAQNLSDVQSSAQNLANATDPLVKRKRELEKLKTEQEIRNINANLNPQP